MERSSVSLAFRQLKIGAMMRYHHTPIRMAKLPDAVEDAEKWGPTFTDGGMLKGTATLENGLAASL